MAKIPYYHQDQLANSAVEPARADQSGAMIANSILGNTAALAGDLQQGNSLATQGLAAGANQGAQIVAGNQMAQYYQNQYDLRRAKAHADAEQQKLNDITQANYSLASAHTTDNLGDDQANLVIKSFTPQSEPVKDFNDRFSVVADTIRDQRYKAPDGTIKDPIGAAMYDKQVETKRAELEHKVKDAFEKYTIANNAVEYGNVKSEALNKAATTGGDPATLMPMIVNFNDKGSFMAHTVFDTPKKADDDIQDHIGDMVKVALQGGITKIETGRKDTLSSAGDDRLAAIALEKENINTINTYLQDPTYTEILNRKESTANTLKGMIEKTQRLYDANRNEYEKALDARTESNMSQYTSLGISAEIAARGGDETTAAKAVNTIDDQIQTLQQTPNAEQDKRTNRELEHLRTVRNQVIAAGKAHISEVNQGVDRMNAEELRQYNVQKEQQKVAMDQAYASPESNALRARVEMTKLALPQLHKLEGNDDDMRRINAFREAVSQASTKGAFNKSDGSAATKYSDLTGLADAYYQAAEEKRKGSWSDQANHMIQATKDNVLHAFISKSQDPNQQAIHSISTIVDRTKFPEAYSLVTNVYNKYYDEAVKQFVKDPKNAANVVSGLPTADAQKWIRNAIIPNVSVYVAVHYGAKPPPVHTDFPPVHTPPAKPVKGQKMVNPPGYSAAEAAKFGALKVPPPPPDVGGPIYPGAPDGG